MNALSAAFEMATTYRKSAATIQCLYYDNTKLRRCIELINQRDDVTDDCRKFILEVLNGKKGTH